MVDNDHSDIEEEEEAKSSSNNAADDDDRNLNPQNIPDEKVDLFKSESVDLTAEQTEFQNAKVEDQVQGANDEDNEDEKEDGEGAIHQPYLGKPDLGDIAKVRSYVHRFKSLLDSFEADFQDPSNLSYYLLSTAFLSEWKDFVSYQEMLNSEPPGKLFGKVFPRAYNFDLLKSPENEELLYSTEEERVELKTELREGQDFIIVTSEIMDFFKEEFHGRDIRRRAYILPDGHKRVEIYYKKVNLVIITHQVLKDADNRQIFRFKENYAFCFSQKNLREFKETLTQIVQSHFSRRSSYYSSYSTFKPEQLRLWKLDSDITLSAAFDYVKKVCSNTGGYEYRIEMNGKFLENDLDLKVGDLGLRDSEYLIVEVREENKAWNFIQDGIPNMEKCEYCNRYEKLAVYCACKKVGYCNEECRLKDKRFHSLRCEKTDEEELEEATITPDSRLGLTGLTNLGNTCFMNSALQCISHTYELTKYFLEDRFKPEINVDNPLGSKGKLTEKYSILLKNLWLKSSPIFSPYGIKGALAKLNPMFSGYSQHDSQEFLCYLLDGLHEDLNRVKQKPYTETIESNGRKDDVVARISWFNHLKRNNSIITDLMHGQYKSKITCPDCKHVSITFDPFLSCTLPLPTKEMKKIDFYFIWAENRTIPVKVEILFRKRNHFVSNLKDQVIKELEKVKKVTAKSFDFYFLGNSSMTKVTTGTPTNDVTKKHNKIGTLFAVEKLPEFVDLNENQYIEVAMSFSQRQNYYSNYYSKRPITFIRPMNFLRKSTTNEIHLQIFQYFRFFFEELIESESEKDEFLKMTDIEAYAKLFGKPDERPYEVLIQSNARSYLSCYFCGEYRCDNCKLSEKDDETLDDLLMKIKNKEFAFEMEVNWVNPSIYQNHDISSRFHKCEDLKKALPPEDKKEDNEKFYEDEKEEEKKGSASSGIRGKRPAIITKGLDYDKSSSEEEKSLYECFKLFSEPETLNADNAWYCSNCKAHKEANKEMRIYKSPKYLILHLKRFKGGESILSAGKISTKIVFPMILDLTEMVMDHSLPTQYEHMTEEELNELIKADKNKEVSNAEEKLPITEEKSDAMIEEKNLIESEEGKSFNSKIEEAITDSHSIDFTQKSPLLYRLYAVSNHYGSVGFGHYTAYALHPKDGEWYGFDDSSVSRATEKEVVSSAAYILFYERFDSELKDDKPLNFDIKKENNSKTEAQEVLETIHLGNSVREERRYEE